MDALITQSLSFNNKKNYSKPEIIQELLLEIKAGTPIGYPYTPIRVAPIKILPDVFTDNNEP
jgi:hypothetical protein